MKEHPILFNGAMVRAILDGRKTQTRRPIKPQPPESWHPTVGAFHPTKVDRNGIEFPGKAVFGASDEEFGCRAPFAVGDRLWVRETWGLCAYGDPTDFYQDPVSAEGLIYDPGSASIFAKLGSRDAFSRCNIEYRADWVGHEEDCHWRPSIHMPRWASRITLEVIDIRPERVQDIPQSDALAEGIDHRRATGMSPGGSGTFCVGKNHHASTPRESFALLWESVYGKGPFAWANNPWVWAVTFKRVTP